MRIYLDLCCFNRPFDTQSHFRIRLESEAKLQVQAGIREKHIELVWSYILDYENSRNPWAERREQIGGWRKWAAADIVESQRLLDRARKIAAVGIGSMDALHIACAIEGGAQYFLTTDDTILKRLSDYPELRVVDPVKFIQETTA